MVNRRQSSGASALDRTEPGVVAGVPFGAGHRLAVRAGRAVPPWSARQGPAAFLAAGVDGPEGWRGEGGEDAGVGGDGGGDAFAAAESGADELVGVGAVDLGAGQAPGGAAGLAGDRQDTAGLMDRGVAVQQLAGASVYVVDPAAEQDGLGAAACVVVLVS